MKNKNNLFKDIFPFWLTMVVVITFLCGFIYVSVQQTLRQDANDPQIQVAEDLANQLSRTARPPTLNAVIDLKKSLATFVIIFNIKGKPVSSTAYLDNQIPVPPLGVFQFAEKFNENRITWQPQNNVRLASVIVPYGNKLGFVLVGRSLREVEKRVDKITLFAAITWLGAIFGSLIVLILNKFLIDRFF